jgi:hypothetical protein
VATAELLPIYTKLSQKILSKAVRSGEAGSYREAGDNQIVEGLDLFWLTLRCPTHAWTWPRANNEEHFQGFDAHQTCHKCTSRRLFDTQKWQSGPVYRRRSQPTARIATGPLRTGQSVEQPNCVLGAV